MASGGHFCSNTNLVVTILLARVMLAVLYRTTPSLSPYPLCGVQKADLPLSPWP